MFLRFNTLWIIPIFFILIFFQAPVFGENNEKYFPYWVKQVIGLWVDEKISDSEFIDLVENILNKNILPNKISEDRHDYSIPSQNQLYQETNQHIVGEYERIPIWVKQRASWWIDGKISDEQFLRTIYYLRNVGFLEYNPVISIFSNDDTSKASLEKFLLTEEEIQKITIQTKWRYASTDYDFEEKIGIRDSVKILLQDITRTYEPILYKFKIPTMIMQISEFNNETDLENYWNTFEGNDKQSIFENAYLTGAPNENSECYFNYSYEGAISSCIYDNMIIQVLIYDKHNEHFRYSTNELVLDETEPTTKFLSEILEKISKYTKTSGNYQLHKILTSKVEPEKEEEIPPENNFTVIPKTSGLEKSNVFGIKNFSCVRDDFGLVTISGQYNNNNIKKEKVDLEITFFDNKNNSIGKSVATLHDLNEFESKKIIGHTIWDGKFFTCKIKVQ